MKKFTKGCLMTALVLFLVGLILSVVCGLLGGFRQLNKMGISDWPVSYYRNAAGDWVLGRIRAPEGILDLEELEGKKEQLSLTADTLGSLEIDVEACDVVVWESEDANAWIFVDGNNSYRPRYSIENDGGKSRLRIENEVEHYYWRNAPYDTVYLWLPKGCAFEECDIDMGAGYMGSIFLKAKEMKVNVGAGLLETDGFEGEEVSLTVGAGELIADRITAGTANLEVGAGHMVVGEVSVSGEMDLELSAGMAEVAGAITGDLDLECDMGEVVMRLTGSEEDHSYNVECGMGTVTVGSYDHGGFAAEQSWNSGKNSTFTINCNMGNVTVTFEE